MIFSTLGKATRALLKPLGFSFTTRQVAGVPIVLWEKRLSTRLDDNRAMVMVPGLGDSPISWVPLVALLLREKSLKQLGLNRLVLIELPGGLGSMHGAAGISTADALIAIMKEVVDDLKPKYLIGQSMGGFLVGHYAAHQKPSWLEKVVMMCPSGMVLHGDPLGEWMQVLREVAEGKPDNFVRHAVGSLTKHKLFSLPARAFANELRSYLVRPDVQQHINSYTEEHTMDDCAKNITAPVMLIWGEQDTLVPFYLFHEWEKRLKLGTPKHQHRFLRVRDAGHGVHVEQPQTVAPAMLHFFSES